MKKLVTILVLLAAISTTAQERYNPLDPKRMEYEYFLKGGTFIERCEDDGDDITNEAKFRLPIEPGVKFKLIDSIVRDSAKSYIIVITDWEPKQRYSDQITKYNITTKTVTAETENSEIESLQETEQAYYLISHADLKNNVVRYKPLKRWEPVFGVITYLARIRPGVHDVKSVWSTDLSLGLSVGAQVNINKTVGMSFLGGISITKVTLDQPSTRGVVDGSIEKPALTPSFNVLFNYEGFSIGLAAGTDIVNHDSPESNAWIYNGKLFYGISFGFNILNRTKENTTPVAAND